MASWTETDDKVLDRYHLWQLDLISPFLGRRLLEVGAGPGQLAALLCRKGEFQKYVTLEPSDHFYPILKRLEGSCEHLETRKCTIDELEPGLNGTFESVFSVHVMEHVEDDFAFLKRAYDLLAPGGNIIVLVPALQALYSELDRKIGHYRRYDKRMIRDLSRRLGTEIVLNRYDNAVGVLGWWWVCKIRKIDYHTTGNKKTLLKYFDFFSTHVLPFVSRIEKYVQPPIGLNLTAVLRKPS